MPDSEIILSEARAAYQQATNLIDSMVTTLQHTTHRAYESADFIAQYDQILQGILLHIAIADGAISEIEYRFIETITRYGDLLDTLNHRQNPPGNAVWHDFSRIPRPLCKQLIKICDQMVADTTRSFIANMAHLDQTTIHTDELELLRAHTTTIMTALSALDSAPDGSDRKREHTAGKKARLNLLERPWNDALSYL